MKKCTPRGAQRIAMILYPRFVNLYKKQTGGKLNETVSLIRNGSCGTKIISRSANGGSRRFVFAFTSLIDRCRECSARERMDHSRIFGFPDWNAQDRRSDNLLGCCAERIDDCGEPKYVR